MIYVLDYVFKYSVFTVHVLHLLELGFNINIELVNIVKSVVVKKNC